MHYEGYDVPKNFIGGMNHMRTLKKVLALSLVFAMAFTMMAGAAFKDQNKIDSALTNDIQLLTALGVFKGDENGNFNPAANVKRSEAAKMIYVLKNNGVDDGAVAFQGVSKYADVPVGHWAEGYINYCTNLGYMGGWKEGNVQKFDPNGNVTGVELTKMLLCMIGYKADIQGYTGNGWQTNVLVDAATSGLSANFIPSIYGATPRQWTARLMTNALDAEWVTYSKGELTYKGNTYAEQFLNLRTAEGILDETNSNKLGANMNASLNDSDKVRVTLYAPDANHNTTISAVGDADDSLLGQPVKMYYKHAGTTSEAKLYAVLPYAKNHKVVNTTIDAIKYDSNAATTVTIEGLGKMDYTKSTVDPDGPTSTTDDKKVRLYVNNVQDDFKTIDQLKSKISGNDSRAVTVVANKDGYAETILVHDMTAFAKVKKIDASKNTLTLEKASTASFLDGSALKDVSGTANLTFDNSSANKDNFNKYLNVASDVKNGSVVKITVNTSTGKLVYDITLADKVEGTPTGYTLNSDGNAYASLTLNGETVKKASNGLNGYTWANTNTSIATDKTFYTDGKYVVFSEGGTEAASVNNLAYIIAVDEAQAWGKATYKVKALLSDGTIGEYPVAATYDSNGDKTNEATADNGVKKSIFVEGSVVKYSLSDNKITLKDLAGLNSATAGQNNGDIKFVADGTQVYNHNAKTVTVTGSVDSTANITYAVDSNAYFFVKSKVGTSDKYSVVKASELTKEQTGTSNKAFAFKKVNGVPTLVFGTLELTGSVAIADVEYAYVTSGTSVGNVNGKYVISMEVMNSKGETSTLKKSFDNMSDADTNADTWAKMRGKVVTYTLNDESQVAEIKKVNASGTPDAVTADAWNKLVVKGWNNNIISAKVGSTDDQTITVASDVKIHFVDAKTNANYTVLSTGDVQDYQSKADTESAYAYVQEVNKVKVITDIFVEVKGESLENLWK